MLVRKREFFSDLKQVRSIHQPPHVDLLWEIIDWVAIDKSQAIGKCQAKKGTGLNKSMDTKPPCGHFGNRAKRRNSLWSEHTRPVFVTHIYSMENLHSALLG